MFVTKKHLARRTFLLGSFGATVALPLLDAMVPALTAQSRTAANPPFRFGTVYIPNGVFPDTWHPDELGSDFTFKPVMKPLEPFRDQLVTVSKLKAPPGAIHLGASAAFLNGVGPAGKDGDLTALVSKKTIDQFIADKVAGDTPLRSIEVGIEDMATAGGACDGHPCTFFNTLSWRDDTTPLPVGVNPRVTFERMFGETGTVEQRARGLKKKQSLLDSVMDETARLKRALGPADLAVLDDYLTNVRHVEAQLTRMESRLGDFGGTEPPLGIPEMLDEHVTVTYDLMHLAFRADISRVFSFLLGHELSMRGYPHIGIPEAHHSVSHHGGNPENLAKYARICTYHVERFANFVGKLKATPDGDGNILDHAVFYWGAGMGNGNLHDRKNPPAVIVGGANGRLKGNRHLVASKEFEQPTADLLLALGDLAGCDDLPAIGTSWGRFSL